MDSHSCMANTFHKGDSNINHLHIIFHTYPKIQQTKLAITKFLLSLDKAETMYEGRLKVILLLQVSSCDFEPTFIILVLICRILPDQPK